MMAMSASWMLSLSMQHCDWCFSHHASPTMTSAMQLNMWAPEVLFLQKTCAWLFGSTVKSLSYWKPNACRDGALGESTLLLHKPEMPTRPLGIRPNSRLVYALSWRLRRLKY